MSKIARAKALLESAGLLPGLINFGHSLKTLRELDETPCKTCGKPVGKEARGLTECRPCLLGDADIDEVIERDRLHGLGVM